MAEKGFEVKSPGVPSVEKKSDGEASSEPPTEQQSVIGVLALLAVGLGVLVLKQINTKKAEEEAQAAQMAMMAAQEEAEKNASNWARLSGGGSDNNTGVRPALAGGGGSGSPIPDHA